MLCDFYSPTNTSLHLHALTRPNIQTGTDLVHVLQGVPKRAKGGVEAQARTRAADHHPARRANTEDFP